MFWSDDKVLNYEMVDQMKYLDCCIEETLRKYPIIPFVIRMSAKDYKLSNEITIPKKTSIVIPTMGFHRDPEIYENPLQFKPERFLGSTNGKGNSRGIFHLSYGEGPRNCIGAHMGRTIVKICLVLLISKFHLEFKDQQVKNCEQKLDPSKVFASPLGKIELRLKFRRN